MSILKIKEELHHYINNNADESFVQLMWDMMKVHENTKDEDYELTPLQKKELDRRVKMHKSGKSKSYSWEEVKQRILSHRTKTKETG